jgi:hypothetical protein
MWSKKLVAAESKVIWTPNTNAREEDDGAGNDTWENMRKKGHVRNVKPGSGSDIFTNAVHLDWNTAAGGYQLGVVSDGSELVELMEAADLSSKDKRDWFLKAMGKRRIKWEDGHQVIAVKRDSLLEDAHGAWECYWPIYNLMLLVVAYNLVLVAYNVIYLLPCCCSPMHETKEPIGAVANISIQV